MSGCLSVLYSQPLSRLSMTGTCMRGPLATGALGSLGTLKQENVVVTGSRARSPDK